MKNKKAILIFSSYIPSKSMVALRNSGIDTFYLMPVELGDIIDNIKLNPDLSEEETKKELEPIVLWIKKIIKRNKKEFVIVLENFSHRIDYYLYDFIKRNKLQLENDLY